MAEATVTANKPISQPPESPGVPHTLLKKFRTSTKAKTAIGVAKKTDQRAEQGFAEYAPAG